MTQRSAIDLSVPPLSELAQRRGQKWAAVEDDVISLTIAEMDFPLAAPVSDALTGAIMRSDLGYAAPATPALTSALAEFAQRRLSWTIDPEQVTVVPDVMLGLAELCRAIAKPGEAIGFATPAYPPFYHALCGPGVRLTEIELTAEGAIDLDQLDRALATGLRALVLSNPHNPTGRVLPRSELEAVAERCATAQAWVLADEVHAPLVLPGAAHVPWLELSEAARECGVVVTSASKAFNLAALKTAFLVTAGDAPRELVRQLGPQHFHAGLLGEIAAEAAFRDGDAWLDAVITQLDENRARLGQLLRGRLPAVSWRPPQGTYLAWLDCRALPLGDDPAEAFLRKGRVALSRGLDYGPPGAGHVRLNFATGPEHLEEAVRRMVASL